MKYLKYLLIIILCITVISWLYSCLISPTVELVNNTNEVIRIAKIEFDNNKIEPEYDDIKNSFLSEVSLKSNTSYSYDVSMKSILSEKVMRMDTSYEKGEFGVGKRFTIGQSGFCKYTIDIYDGYADIKTSKINLCYKKLYLVE